LSSKSDRLRKNEFWALKDVSFELKKGECLGIVGSNGAGKTTVLSLLNGIYLPDKGKIMTKGKVGPLIAVGAGFNPVLTGRENIYINGAVLGMSKAEINEKFDSIVEFADIGDFLDTPVKNYSTGMYMRLGFAVAIHSEPDILLVDEVLSVGDIKFREKSQRKFMELLDMGTSVVFVSHTIEYVRRICNKTMLLNKGKVIDFGDTEAVVNNYSLVMDREELKSLDKMKEKYDLLPWQSIGRTGKIELFNCKAYEEGRNLECNEIEFGKNIVIECEYKCYEEIKNPEFQFSIKSAFDRKVITSLSTLSKPNFPSSIEGKGKIRFIITNNNLHQGVYHIDIAASVKAVHLFYFNNCQQFIIKRSNLPGRDVLYLNLLVDFEYIVENFNE